MPFAEKLKEARQMRGLTQQEVAERLGVSKSTYCGYETGRQQPDVRKIKQLAAILQTSGDQLLETATVGSLDLTPEEQELIHCFRRAAQADRQAILLLLSKYRHLDDKNTAG